MKAQLANPSEDIICPGKDEMKHARSSSSLAALSRCGPQDGDKLPQEGTSPLLTGQARAATAAPPGCTLRFIKGLLIPASKPNSGKLPGQRYGIALLRGELCRDWRAEAAHLLVTLNGSHIGPSFK